MEDALEELVRRASRGNLYIGIQGRLPPGPAIVTYLEENESIETLEDIKYSLGAGNVYTKPTAIWVAYDNEAIIVIIDLMPYLKKAERSKEIGKRICWAGNLLNDWRRKYPTWRRVHEDNPNC